MWCPPTAVPTLQHNSRLLIATTRHPYNRSGPLHSQCRSESHAGGHGGRYAGPKPGAGFTKPCALLKLDFLTSAYNKCMTLVRKSSFSKAQGLRETGPWAQRGQLAPVGNGTKTKTITRPNLTSVRSLGPIHPVV